MPPKGALAKAKAEAAQWMAKAKAAALATAAAQGAAASWRGKAGAARRAATVLRRPAAAPLARPAAAPSRPRAPKRRRVAAEETEEDEELAEEEEPEESEATDDEGVDPDEELPRRRPAATKAASKTAGGGSGVKASQVMVGSVLGLAPPDGKAGSAPPLTAGWPGAWKAAPPPLAPGLRDGSLGGRLRAAVDAAKAIAVQARASAAPPVEPSAALGAPAPVINPAGPPWVNLAADPSLLSQVGFAIGAPFEVTLENPPGVLAATALFLAQAVFPTDSEGILLEVFFMGASEPSADSALAEVFPGPGNGAVQGLVHICGATCGSAPTTAGRPVLHADCFRHRRMEEISEPWATRGRAAALAKPSGMRPQLRADQMEPLGLGAEAVTDATARAELEAKVAMLKAKLAEKKSTFSSKLAARAQAFARGGRVAQEAEPSEAGASSSAKQEEAFRHVSGGVSRLKSPAEVAREVPGQLYELGLGEVIKFIGNRLGNEAMEDEAPSIMTYLQAIFHGHLPQGQVGHRTSREMATIGACLDALAKGDLPHLGDVLMQRFKKLEVEAMEGDERAGETLELLPSRPVGLAGQQELEAAQAEEIRRSKVRQARKGQAASTV